MKYFQLLSLVAGSILFTAAAPAFGQNSDWPSVQYNSFVSSFPNSPAPFDEFGEVLDLSGDTMIVGVPDKQPTATEEGAVYIMTRNEGGADEWGETVRLDRGVFGNRIQGGYGSAVAIDGDTAAVAISRYEESLGDPEQGVVVIYERNDNATDPWREVEIIFSPDNEPTQRFGASIDLCNDTLIVGAPGKDETATDQGAAYVFERNTGGADSWGFVAKLTDPLGAEDYALGSSVAISGENAAAGAPGDLGIAFSGLVLTFNRNRWDFGATQTPSADNWGLEKRIAAPNSGEEAFGYSLAMRDDLLVVGQRFYGVEAIDTGAAFIYQRQIPGSGVLWQKVKDLLPENPQQSDRFGTAVDISGDIIVVGAPGRPGFDLYHRNTGGPDNWGLTQSNSVDGSADDRFGQAVAISGYTVAVGEPDYLENPGALGGQVLMYNLIGHEWLQCLPSLRARHDPAEDASMGLDVDIHGDHAIVGGRGFAHILRRNYDADTPGTPEYEEWDIVKTLTAPTGSDPLEFGREVAITASHAAVSDDEFVHIFDRDYDGVNAAPSPDQWGFRVKNQVVLNADYTMGDIALDKDTLIVGRPSVPTASAVLVYYQNEGGPNNWGQVFGLGNLGDTFGTSVDLSNDTAVVGRGSQGGNELAFAIIIERNEGTPDEWQRVTSISQGTGFRPDVAIDVDTVAVGRPVPNDKGEVAIYERNTGGTDNWGLVKTVTDPLGFSNTLFGFSVDLAAETLVVGTPNLGWDQSLRLGLLYTFSRNIGGADNWGLEFQAVPNARGDDKNFGWAVATNGVHAIAGSPRNKLGSPVLTSVAGDATILRWDWTPYWDWVKANFDPSDYNDPLRYTPGWGPMADIDEDDIPNHWEQIIETNPLSALSGWPDMPRSGGPMIYDGNGIDLIDFPVDSRLEIQYASGFLKNPVPWTRAALLGRAGGWETEADFSINFKSIALRYFELVHSPVLATGQGYFRSVARRR